MKIPAGKGNPELLEQIKQTFSVIPGIERISVNPTTGSVVLHYDEDHHDEFHGHVGQHVHGHRPPESELDSLANAIENEAEFLAEHSHTARVVVDFFKSADRQIKAATGNLVDLKIILALALIGFTVLEVGVNAATPVWVTLVVFGVNHFIEMHPPRPSAAGAAPAQA